MDKMINFLSGELIENPDRMTDEELMAHLKDLEQVAAAANFTLRAVKGILTERMVKDGAKLRLLSLGKLRLHADSRVRDKKLVEALYKECPTTLREKCFAVDLRPLKTGLKELGKMGADWQKKVDELYEVSNSLKVEWNQEIPSETPYASDVDNVVVPF